MSKGPSISYKVIKLIDGLKETVILSETKNLVGHDQILRGVYTERSECAQDDRRQNSSLTI